MSDECFARRLRLVVNEESVPVSVRVQWIRMTILDPKKLVCKRKFFVTSKFEKLEKWNKTRIYPNPITYRGAFENLRNENHSYKEACLPPFSSADRSISSPPSLLSWNGF